MKKYLILFIALVLGSFLRLWHLADVPNGLTWDEAAIGYNAYSILKTGRDEHGAFLPIVFKSFGDYKPGAYIYLTVPSVAIFGLNEFAVRFPSALAGILTILGVYLLTKEIFFVSLSKNKHLKSNIQELIPQFAALAVAVSPWLVHFSHGAWEVNVFSALTVFSIYYFLRFTNGKSSIYPTLFLACISLAMYQAAKLLTPLVFLLLLIIYWKEFWKAFLHNISATKIVLILPFVIFGLWILAGSLFGSAGNRLSTLSIFNYKPDRQVDSALFHNQTELSTSLVVSRYLYHFSPEVLLYEGPVISERGHIPSLGVLNPLEFIWLTFGIYWLVKNFSKRSALIIGLLLIAPMPASLTLAEFSTVRALFMAVPLAVISGIGIFSALEKLKLLAIPVLMIYLLVAVYVFDVYYFHSQTAYASEFNYGYKQVVEIIKENPADKVVFTDVYGQPYIYYVFYTAYDPKTYQENIDFVDGGLDVGKVGRVGNVEFHQFGTDDMVTQKNTLFIGSEGNINREYDIAGDDVDLFRQIDTPDNKILFRVIKTKQ